MPCLQIIAVTMAHIIVGGIDQGSGAEYTRHECYDDQSVRVRTASEIKIDTAHINAMKADGLGAMVVSCVKRKKWGLESVGWRWHWKRICK